MASLIARAYGKWEMLLASLQDIAFFFLLFVLGLGLVLELYVVFGVNGVVVLMLVGGVGGVCVCSHSRLGMGLFVCLSKCTSTRTRKRARTSTQYTNTNTNTNTNINMHTFSFAPSLVYPSIQFAVCRLLINAFLTRVVISVTYGTSEKA